MSKDDIANVDYGIEISLRFDNRGKVPTVDERCFDNLAARDAHTTNFFGHLVNNLTPDLRLSFNLYEIDAAFRLYHQIDLDTWLAWTLALPLCPTRTAIPAKRRSGNDERAFKPKGCQKLTKVVHNEVN